jgi:hypothetical protein
VQSRLRGLIAGKLLCWRKKDLVVTDFNSFTAVTQ